MDQTLAIPVFYTSHPIIKRITDFTLVNIAEEIDLEDLARIGNISTFYLCRLFKKEIGISPMKWLWTQRTMTAASFLLSENNLSLTNIAFSCGFTSSAHFSRLFKTTYGISPSTYRKTNSNFHNYPRTRIVPESIILVKNTPIEFVTKKLY